MAMKEKSMRMQIHHRHVRLLFAIAVFSVILTSLIAVGGCTYNIHGTPTYDDSGVRRLYSLPSEGSYKNLGLHSWGFYRPGVSEPMLADVWDALAEKVKALGGNACIVRYEKVGNITARTLEVTCEVLKLN
jgi:hypothetical protein